jgi:hypothetical protein
MKTLRKLNRNNQAELLEQAAEVLKDWNEEGNPEIVWNGYGHECQLNNQSESVLVLYKCSCGQLIAEQEEVGELCECSKCGKW